MASAFLINLLFVPILITEAILITQQRINQYFVPEAF